MSADKDIRELDLLRSKLREYADAHADFLNHMRAGNLKPEAEALKLRDECEQEIIEKFAALKSQRASALITMPKCVCDPADWGNEVDFWVCEKFKPSSGIDMCSRCDHREKCHNAQPNN